MGRRARMLRRTLLCAVFACPLAMQRPRAALALLAAWTLLAVLPAPGPALPWAKSRRSPRASRRRVLMGLICALALAAALPALAQFFLPPDRLPAARALALLSGILAQASVIGQDR